MAKMPEGINGHFIGKLGTVVGYYWKGIKVSRGLRKSARTKPFSQKELAQQKKFGLMSSFLTGAGNLLNMTFAKDAIGKTGYSVAFSYNIKNAVAGEYPDLSINYASVKVGTGSLVAVEAPAAICMEKNTIQFTWANNSETANVKASDRAYVAVYRPDTNIWYTRIDVAGRRDGICKIDLGNFGATLVHTWIGFMLSNGKDASDSVYTGVVQLI